MNYKFPKFYEGQQVTVLGDSAETLHEFEQGVQGVVTSTKEENGEYHYLVNINGDVRYVAEKDLLN